VPRDTLTAAQWAALVAWNLAHDCEMTTDEVAELGGRSHMAAYTLLCQISGLAELSLYQDCLDGWKWKILKPNS
jgi:hypothetical protein